MRSFISVAAVALLLGACDKGASETRRDRQAEQAVAEAQAAKAVAEAEAARAKAEAEAATARAEAERTRLELERLKTEAEREKAVKRGKREPAVERIVDYFGTLKDGQSEKWRLSPGHYRLHMTADGDGAVIRWTGETCEQPKNGISKFAAECMVKTDAQLTLTNPDPTGLGTGRSVTATLIVERIGP